MTSNGKITFHTPKQDILFEEEEEEEEDNKTNVKDEVDYVLANLTLHRSISPYT